MNIFEKVFKALNRAKLQYVIAGGVAVNLHGYVRFTGDLDLLILMEEENLKKMDKVMKSLGYSERLPVSILALKDKEQVQKWLKEKNMMAYSFVPPVDNPLQIDVIVEESLRFLELKKNKVVKHISSVPIPVVSIQDLIKMKKRAGREQDLADLTALVFLKNL